MAGFWLCNSSCNSLSAAASIYFMFGKDFQQCVCVCVVGSVRGADIAPQW
jgi:hypothetical protein